MKSKLTVVFCSVLVLGYLLATGQASGQGRDPSRVADDLAHEALIDPTAPNPADQRALTGSKAPVVGILYNRIQAEKLAKGSDTLTNYVRAITDNGGTTTNLSPALTAVEIGNRANEIDGLLIPGGDDIDPALYRADRDECCEASDPEFDRFESNVISAAVGRGIPILGICRGHQFLNVWAGGTLLQDIPTQLHSFTNVVHRTKDATGNIEVCYHWITILKGSYLWKLLHSVRLEVNSAHHQGIQELAQKFHAVGWSDDGLVEAIEDDSGTILGVQFHPERLRLMPNYEVFNGIFVDFVKRAKATAAGTSIESFDQRGHLPMEAQKLIDKSLEDHRKGAMDMYCDVHSHPELSGFEQRTSSVLAKSLVSAGFQVKSNFGIYPPESSLFGHSPVYGVVAVMTNGFGPVLYIRVEEDALPVTENTGKPYASKNNGVMHACGHPVHMAALMEAANILAGDLKKSWSGTLVIVCEPAEERGSGTEALLNGGLYKQVPMPNFAIAMHDDPNLESGKVGCRTGVIFANAGSVTIVIHGEGGHAAMPDLTKDPIRLNAQLVPALEAIPGREISATHPVVITVGSTQGGQKGNVIPNTVTNLISIRWIYDEDYKQITRHICRLARGFGVVGGLLTNLSSSFSVDDITNLASMAKKLDDTTNNFSAYLMSRMGSLVKPLLAGYVSSNANAEILQLVLVNELNKIVAAESLVGRDLLRDVVLRPGTLALTNADSASDELARLNRMILEDVYSNELKRIPETFIEVQIGKSYTPAINNDPYLTRRVIAAEEKILGSDNVVESPLELLADDFSRLGLRGQIPICMFRLGATDTDYLKECRKTGNPPPQLHSAEFAPDYEKAIQTGAKAYIGAVLELLRK